MRARVLQVLVCGASLQLAAAPAVAKGGYLYIPKNTVVKLVSEDELSFRTSREGDHFLAKAEDDRDVPDGTRFNGRVLHMHGGDKPYMDLELTSMVMPDGTRTDITAVPISLDSKSIHQEKDGRLVCDTKKIKSENYVFGGLVGGLLFGALLHKPFEGAFIGTLAGILLSEADRAQNKNGDVVLRKGTHFGALFTHDASINFTEDPRSPDQNRDDRQHDSDRGRDGHDADDARQHDHDRSNRNLDIVFDGKGLSFDKDAKPYRSDDTIMVPVEKFATQLGFKVSYGQDRKVIYIEDDDNTLRLAVDSTAYRLNGTKGDLSKSVTAKGDVFYVPIRIFASMTSKTITVDGTRIEPLT